MNRLYINMVNVLSEARRDERGASGVEYGILVAAIAALIVVAALSIGGKISDAFDAIDDAL